MLYTQTFREEPLLLSSNKEVPFRNSVIHKGNIPQKAEAIEFGNSALQIIEASLIKLKNKFPEATNDTFDYYGYNRIAHEQIKKDEKKSGIEQNVACVNIMTTINVKHGREINKEDGRKGNIEQRIPNILEGQNPRKLFLSKCKPV